MNEDYVSYEIAVKLKACGFDEPCDHYYAYDEESKIKHLLISASPSEWDWNYAELPEFVHPECSAPHIYRAQKWLREKKGIAINVIAHDGGAYDYDIVFLPNAADCNYPIDRATFSRTYEEALSEGIKSALELFERKEES